MAELRRTEDHLPPKPISDHEVMLCPSRFTHLSSHQALGLLKWDHVSVSASTLWRPALSGGSEEMLRNVNWLNLTQRSWPGPKQLRL